MSNEMFTEEEERALSNPEGKVDEPEPTSEEIKVETEGTPTPEPEGELKPTEEPKPEIKEEEKPSQAIDGILTKDGKNVIPFNVLEQERQKRQQLESELAEFKKPKPEVKVESTKVEKPTEGIDFKILATKLYESPEGAAEVLKTVFDSGVKAAEQAAKGIGSQSVVEVLFNEKVGQIKAANSWLTPEMEKVAFVFAQEEISKDPNFNPNDINALVRVAENSVVRTKELLKVGQPAFDPETERKKIREEVTKEIMQKFNITEPKVKTLANVRNINPDVLNKFDQIDSLTGLDFEEAMGKLTPQEREAFLARSQ